MDLSQIYTEVITEHSRAAHNRKQLAEVTHKEHGHNPSCGDDIMLELDIKDGRIADAAFSGSGCAISQASTSGAAGSGSKGKSRELFGHDQRRKDRGRIGRRLRRCSDFGEY